MAYSVDLHPIAQDELDESFHWYEERQPGLGERFISYVDKRISEIAKHPERYSKKKGNFRETLVDVFPFVIIYELIGERIFITHIFHAKRNPSLKYRRR
jgi:plasmid stabilization system protein ParE